MPDGVRVACHLWPAGSDGVHPAWSTPTREEVVIGADATPAPTGPSTEVGPSPEADVA